MQISIETEKCCGAGQCVLAAPEVFDQREDDGIVILLEENTPESEHENVRQAAALCPAACIAVHE